MKKTAPDAVIDATTCWAAAWVAQETNNDYIKERRITINPDTGLIIREDKPNREIMFDLINAGTEFSEDILAKVATGREWLSNFLVIKALTRGQLSNFEKSMRDTLEKETFSMKSDKFYLAVLACLPSSILRGQQDESVKEKVAGCIHPHIGKVGERLTFSAEVIKQQYNHNFNIFFITAITDNDQPILFSYKSKINVGTKIKVVGTVKDHLPDVTRINRAKIIG